MKKHFLLFLTLLFLLSGCSGGKAKEISVNHPYEIAKGTSTLSYYDTGDNIHMEGIRVEELTDYHWPELIDQMESFILVNDGKVRYIFIADEDVVTYRQISVGDDIDKVKRAFRQIRQWSDDYEVLFNKDDEEEPFGENKEDDWICIDYRTDGSKITAIFIRDVTFTNKLR